MIVLLRRSRYRDALLDIGDFVPYRTFPSLVCVVTAGMCVFPPRPAAAQDISSPFRFVDQRHAVSLLYGYTGADRGTAEMASDAGSLFGARYAFRVGGPVNVVAEALSFASTRTVFDLTEDEEPVPIAVGEGDFNLLLVNAGLRFDLTGPRSYHNLMPYLLVMGGGAIETSDAPAIEADIAAQNRFDFGTKLSGIFAAGTDVLLGQRLSLSVEARQMLWKLEIPEPFATAETGFPSEEWTGNLTVLLGANLRF